MVKKIEDLNFYELLEVSPTATSQEIHRAYERVRRIYEPNSIALYSLFTPEETSVIHERIEEAYRTLLYENNRKKYDTQLKNNDIMIDTPPRAVPPSPQKYQAPDIQPGLPLQSENRYMRTEPEPSRTPAPAVQQEVSPVSPLIAEFTGPVIKILREQRNLSVKNIADTTKVSSRYIEFIEEENYQRLPARPYLRGFLVLYAKALGYEPERVVSDYLKRYDSALGKPK